MKNLRILSLIAVSGLFFSCSAEDTYNEQEVEAVAETENDEFIPKLFDKEALAEAFAVAWKDINIDFTKVFTYTTKKEATKEIQNFLLEVQKDVQWELEEYPDSDAVIANFKLDNGVGRLQEVHYINEAKNTIIKSFVSDNNKGLEEKEFTNTANQLIDSSGEGWIFIDEKSENISDYSSFKAKVTAAATITLLAHK
ncbi:hypothetical protein GCM10007424_03500 [Flavobacterium suaedae]|uniref:DUF4878 domain-containing protein n=1 Tax=Flavobacterium suaedae TaxID=1767027 RepID=A0ABQ1JEE5_9FLAO|nr:hypothetical protein [Flavobacterium suaedae]GGB66809.1 hypothetical protein GCM10007424_03500 [Flavobacterium suaedae]